MTFVGQSLEQLAAEDPGRACLSCGERAWTRAALSGEIARLAAHLAARVPFGARVALSLKDPARLLVSFFAVGRIGGVAMVYDPDWPEARRRQIDQAVKPALTLTDEVTGALLADGEADPGLLATRGPRPADAFYAGFTSGSTGTPKGYCRSHKSWLESFKVSDSEFALAPEDRIIIPGNMVHSLHLYGAVHGLCSGAHVLVFERFAPRRLVESFAEEAPAVLYATPTQIRLLAAEVSRTAPAAALRLVLASGAKWRGRDRRDMAPLFPNARLVEFYGASEMSFITLSTPEDKAPDGSVGRTAEGVQVRVLEEDGTVCPFGRVGTIWVKSAMLYSGYICGGGSEVVRDGAWLTVGDCGYMDEQGFLFLAGRKKRMIVTSGVNVFPEEVEDALLDHPGVRAAAVVAVADPLRGQVMAAAVVAQAGARPETRELRRHCAARLGRARSPRHFLFLPELPLTAGGKADLVALAALVRQTLQEMLPSGIPEDGREGDADEQTRASTLAPMPDVAK